MFLTTNVNLINTLPILKLSFFRNEISIVSQTFLIKNILKILKYHINYQFKVLTCISGVDYPENYYRFSIVYELLSLKFNKRIRLKILLDEITPVDSVDDIFINAHWWECEIWDMFGVYFIGENEIVRLLTDYGFLGYPLRKDFPLSGYIELRYNATKSRVVYEHLELAQEYRTFDFLSPWENV